MCIRDRYQIEAGKITTSGTDTAAAPGQIENRGKTYIEIIKQDHYGHLIDAPFMKTSSFSLYQSEADALDNRSPIETITGGTTKFKTPLEPETTYWVRERKAPNGYVLDETPYPITTGSTVNSIASLTLQNSPYGSLTIEKLARWELPSTSSAQILPLSEVCLLYTSRCV